MIFVESIAEMNCTKVQNTLDQVIIDVFKCVGMVSCRGKRDRRYERERHGNRD